jgi:predicted Zn-dependent protease
LNGVTDTQLLNAVNGWMNDTGKVTNFLNTATSLTGNDYTTAATIALNAEKDELNHKAVLDAGLDPAAIQKANDTLATQGTFQAVVDALQASKLYLMTHIHGVP